MTIAYVVKRYPRYSETFVVNEILAHQAAGLKVRIYSLLSTTDEYFQDLLAKVRSPVRYLHADNLKAIEFWSCVRESSLLLPDLCNKLQFATQDDARAVYQAILLAAEVRTQGIQHIHAHFASSATTVARLAAHFAGVPYTFTAHAKDIFHDSVQPEDLRKKLADAAGVVTVSRYNVEYLRQNFGDFSRNVRCIYNGMDLDRLRFASPLHRMNEIVAVGRLVEKKGFADLINACASLLSRKVEFRCKIIGTGELYATLRAQISSLGLDRHVYLLGPLPQTELIHHIQNAATLVAPCVIGTDGNRDGLPTVLLEAMALGTPCISTDVTGIPEIVRHEITGLMAPQHDPSALSRAIEKLLLDGALRERLARNARELIEAEFDLNVTTRDLRSLFELPANQPLASKQVV
jgi:colanic acid/amylovoran biosynthesis glycosyltransferase